MTRGADEKGQKRQELQAYGDIAEAVSPVLHEVGNLLNTMVLEAGNLERQASNELRPGFQKIRQCGRQLAALLHQFAGYRSSKSPRPYPVDLHDVLRAAAQELDSGAARLELVLAPEPALVAGSIGQLRLLVRLLLANVGRATAVDGGRVTVRTACQDGHVTLTVEDEGPSLPEGYSESPLGPVRDGESAFELAACQSVVRRLHGMWQTVNRTDGVGVITTVQLATCPE